MVDVLIFAWVIRRGLLPWYLTLRHGSINAGVNLPVLTNIWLIPAERPDYEMKIMISSQIHHVLLGPFMSMKGQIPT